MTNDKWKFARVPPFVIRASPLFSHYGLVIRHFVLAVFFALAFLTTASAPKFTTAEAVSWTENSAAIAFILMRRPVRVAMHANALIAAEEA